MFTKINPNEKSKAREKKKKSKPVINYTYVDTLQMNNNFLPMYLNPSQIMQHTNMASIPGYFHSHLNIHEQQNQ